MIAMVEICRPESIRRSLMRPSYTSALLLLIIVLTSNRLAAAPLRIAYSSISGAMLPLWVAKDKGFFAKHGVTLI